MPTTCSVEFENNPSKVCYSGSLLRGSVTLTLTNPKSCRGVYIKIKGEGYARWSEGSGKNRKTYTGSETYIEERVYFEGERDGEITVSPGVHHYTFQCFLPAELPTSMEGNHGHIRYNACVVIDIPMWPDKEFDYPFTVVKLIDLNQNPILREPVHGVKRKTFYPCFICCCIESDPLDMTVNLPVGGFTPGQTINISIDAKNKSDNDVSIFHAALIKEITYHIYANSGRKKVDTETIVEEETMGGCHRSQNDFYRLNLRVPPIPPTDDTTSNICKVRYYVRVYGSVECCHRDPTITIPVIIGSYPLDDMSGTAPTFTGNVPLANADDETTPMNDNAPPYPGMPSKFPYPSAPNSGMPSAPDYGSSNAVAPSLPFPSAPGKEMFEPPTYEEAMRPQQNPEGFKPKYPMFRRNTSYSNDE